MSEILNEIEELGLEILRVDRTETVMLLREDLSLAVVCVDGERAAMLKHRGATPDLHDIVYYWPIDTLKGQILIDEHYSLSNVFPYEGCEVITWQSFEEMLVYLKRML